MIVVTLDKLYHGFNKILQVFALHLFHDNFIFCDFRASDRNSVLPVKQQVVIKLVKKYLTCLFVKR